jgi:hypothetical protein
LSCLAPTPFWALLAPAQPLGQAISHWFYLKTTVIAGRKIGCVATKTQDA